MCVLRSMELRAIININSALPIIDEMVYRAKAPIVDTKSMARVAASIYRNALDVRDGCRICNAAASEKVGWSKLLAIRSVALLQIVIGFRPHFSNPNACSSE